MKTEVSVSCRAHAPLNPHPTPRTGPVLFAVIRENSCNKAIQIAKNQNQYFCNLVHHIDFPIPAYRHFGELLFPCDKWLFQGVKMSLTSWRKSLEQILDDKVAGLDNFSQV